MRRSLVVLALLLASSVVVAQSPKRKTASAPAKRSSPAPRESDERPPRLAAGVSVGAVHFATGRSEQVASGVLQFQALPWLALSMNPTIARATDRAMDSAQTLTTASGVTDLPLAATVSRSWDDARWAPMLGASLGVTLPVGDSAKGLGVGRRSVGLAVAASVSPAAEWQLSLSVGRALSGYVMQSGMTASGTTAVDLAASRDIGSRASTILALSADVGRADSVYAPGRILAGGVAYTVSGPLTLTIDGGRGLTSASPRWLLSIGLGTAFAGVSPVGAASPLQRIRQTAAPGTTSGQTGTTGTGTGTCPGRKKC
jgi:hypothetical protein